MNPSSDQRRIRVAVVFGGRSSEHAISCVTARGILEVLDPSKYEVVPIGIAPSGKWVIAGDDLDQLSISDGRLPEVPETGDEVVLPPGSGLVVQAPGEVPRQLGAMDVVFPVLHGPFGEDGTIQGMLELAGVRYVGSGVLSSAVGMDKHFMKQVLSAAGLRVTRHVLVTSAPWERQRAKVMSDVEDLGWPVFVKPARAGSSMGVAKARNPAELDDAVESAREHDPRVLIEEAVTGREIECGVLEGENGGDPEASVVGEVRFDATHDFYDFQAKYLPGEDVGLDIPADLPSAVAEDVRAQAVSAFQALSCESLARVDFFLRSDGELLVNEVNTMPGFTPTSMFPMLWAKSGIDYAALVDRMISTSMQRPLGLR